jgi:hypothetical protein
MPEQVNKKYKINARGRYLPGYHSLAVNYTVLHVTVGLARPSFSNITDPRAKVDEVHRALGKKGVILF